MRTYLFRLITPSSKVWKPTPSLCKTLTIITFRLSTHLFSINQDPESQDYSSSKCNKIPSSLPTQKNVTDNYFFKSISFIHSSLDWTAPIYIHNLTSQSVLILLDPIQAHSLRFVLSTFCTSTRLSLWLRKPLNYLSPAKDHPKLESIFESQLMSSVF